MDEIKEFPPKIGNIKKSKIIEPQRVKKIFTSLAFFSGRSPIRIFPPSSGWIGIKLKIAKEIFKTMKSIKRVEKKQTGEKGIRMSLNIRESTPAKIRFARGPAKEIKAASRLSSLRL